MSVKHQYYATICCNLLAISNGASCVWGTVNFALLQSDESPVKSGKLSLAQTSLMFSLFTAGNFVGNLLFGFITKRYGRKYPLLFVAAPQIIAWLLVMWPENFWYLYAGNFLAGIVTGSLYLLIPLYVSEIAEDSNRGTLGSILSFAISFGTLLQFIAGVFLPYKMQPILFLVFVLLFSLTFVNFPESPKYLERMKRYTEAEASMRYFHGDFEIQKTEKFLQDIEGAPGHSNYLLNTVNNSEIEKLKFSDFTTRVAKKSLCIGIGLVFLVEFSGIFLLFKYCTFVFKSMDSFLAPGESSIVISIILIISSCIAFRYVDRLGRKFLLISSTVGTGISIALLGTYHYLEINTFPWLPIIIFSAFILTANVGLVPLPNIIRTEIFPEKIRDYSCSFCLSLFYVLEFVLTLIYPTLTEEFGFHNVMWFLAGINFIGAILIKLYLPETRGKSYKEIMNILEK